MKQQPTLTFAEIVKRWRPHPAATPEENLLIIIQAFMRDEFKCDEGSQIYREVTPKNLCGIYCSDADGLVYKIGDGDDAEPNLTGDRELVPIDRNDFIETLHGTNYVPWKWDGTVEGLSAYATIHSWPEVTCRVHFDKWRIAPEDFDRWCEACEIQCLPGFDFKKPLSIRNGEHKKPSRKYAPPNKHEKWYKAYVIECKKKNIMPSEAKDVKAAKVEFNEKIKRDHVRDLRKQFAPSEWKIQGRRKTHNVL